MAMALAGFLAGSAFDSIFALAFGFARGLLEPDEIEGSGARFRSNSPFPPVPEVEGGSTDTGSGFTVDGGGEESTAGLRAVALGDVGVVKLMPSPSGSSPACAAAGTVSFCVFGATSVGGWAFAAD